MGGRALAACGRDQLGRRVTPPGVNRLVDLLYIVALGMAAAPPQLLRARHGEGVACHGRATRGLGLARWHGKCYSGGRHCNLRGSTMQLAHIKPGLRVMCNGYPGAIIRHYSGNMVEVRLGSGMVCVDVGELRALCATCGPECHHPKCLVCRAPLRQAEELVWGACETCS